jgi:hypothetical protein
MCGRHPTAVRNSDQNNNMSIDLKQETAGRGGDFRRGRGPFRRELMRSRERSFGRWLRFAPCFADHATGGNCRRTNERLAADTGLSLRTVQRADTVLQLLRDGHRGTGRPPTHPHRSPSGESRRLLSMGGIEIGGDKCVR